MVMVLEHTVIEATRSVTYLLITLIDRRGQHMVTVIGTATIIKRFVADLVAWIKR